jgi:hypothetical protein
MRTVASLNLPVLVLKLKLGALDVAPLVPENRLLVTAPPLAPVAPFPEGDAKENPPDPVPELVCAAPADACFAPNRPGPFDAGVLEATAPKGLGPPPDVVPKRGFEVGVLEPVLALFAAFPKRDGAEPPDMLPAPKRGCFGVLLPPPDPKVNPDISCVVDQGSPRGGGSSAV